MSAFPRWIRDQLLLGLVILALLGVFYLARFLGREFVEVFFGR